MRSLTTNLAYLRACLKRMDAFIRASDVEMPLPDPPPADSPPFPPMSLGHMLLAADELQALAPGLNKRQRPEIDRVLAQWTAYGAASHLDLQGIARRELRQRIFQWQRYGAQAKERGDVSDYAEKVWIRLNALRLMEWLGTLVPGVAEAYREFALIDQSLLPWMEAGTFLLDPLLAAIYPPTPFNGFLYVQPKRPSS